MCFEHSIFHSDLKDDIYGQEVYRLFIEILQAATGTGIHHRLYCGMISSQKISRNCLCWSYFLIRSIVYSQELYKLCHIQFYEGILKQLHRKLCKISRKMYLVEFLFYTIARIRIQSKDYCQSKNSKQKSEKRAPKGKNALKF